MCCMFLFETLGTGGIPLLWTIFGIQGFTCHILSEFEHTFFIQCQCQVRSFNLGAAFHYDTAVDAKDRREAAA